MTRTCASTVHDTVGVVPVLRKLCEVAPAIGRDRGVAGGTPGAVPPSMSKNPPQRKVKTLLLGVVRLVRTEAGAWRLQGYGLPPVEFAQVVIYGRTRHTLWVLSNVPGEDVARGTLTYAVKEVARRLAGARAVSRAFASLGGAS